MVQFHQICYLVTPDDLAGERAILTRWNRRVRSPDWAFQQSIIMSKFLSKRESDRWFNLNDRRLFLKNKRSKVTSFLKGQISKLTRQFYRKQERNEQT